MNTPSLQPNNNQKNVLYMAYGLFALSIFFGGLPAIAGIILVYIKNSEMQGTIYGDHCAYLIRTFWVSLIAVLVGIVLIFILIGWFVIFATSIWFIFRVIYGLVKLHDDQSVTRTGWFM